jgi:hypothetical protein
MKSCSREAMATRTSVIRKAASCHLRTTTALAPPTDASAARSRSVGIVGATRTMLLAPDCIASRQAAAASWVIATPFGLAATATNKTTGGIHRLDLWPHLEGIIDLEGRSVPARVCVRQAREPEPPGGTAGSISKLEVVFGVVLESVQVRRIGSNVDHTCCRKELHDAQISATSPSPSGHPGAGRRLILDGRQARRGAHELAHAAVEACRRVPGKRRRSISPGKRRGLAPVRRRGARTER